MDATIHGTTVSFHVTNLNAKDARFIADVIRLFTDPANAGHLEQLRDGRGIIHYRHDGQAVVIPIFKHN